MVVVAITGESQCLVRVGLVQGCGLDLCAQQCVQCGVTDELQCMPAGMLGASQPPATAAANPSGCTCTSCTSVRLRATCCFFPLSALF
jgi:hypothetical protein